MVVVGYQKLSLKTERINTRFTLIRGLREIVRSRLSNFTASGLFKELVIIAKE